MPDQPRKHDLQRGCFAQREAYEDLRETAALKVMLPWLVWHTEGTEKMLGRRIILQQPSNPIRRRFECGRSARRVESVNLPGYDHCRQRPIQRNRPDLDLRRQLQRELFGAAWFFLSALKIGRACDRNTILIAENASNPDGRGHLIFGISNSLADQIFRFPNSAVRIDINARVTKGAGGKYRNRNERRIFAKQRYRVGRKRHFGDVELAMPQHPEERLFDDEIEVIDLYAVDGNAFFQQGPRSIVVPTCKSQSKFRHGKPLIISH